MHKRRYFAPLIVTAAIGMFTQPAAAHCQGVLGGEPGDYCDPGDPGGECYAEPTYDPYLYDSTPYQDDIDDGPSGTLIYDDGGGVQTRAYSHLAMLGNLDAERGFTLASGQTVTCGLWTCTIYNTRNQTKRISEGGLWGSTGSGLGAMCSLLAAPGGPGAVVAIPCLALVTAGGATGFLTAQHAAKLDRCLTIKIRNAYTPTPTPSWSSSNHSTRCKRGAP